MPSQFDPVGAANAPPGPVSYVFKVVRDAEGQIGWCINDDLVVSEVVPGGAAARAKIQRGMKVKAVDNVAVNTLAGMKALVGSKTTLYVSADRGHLPEAEPATTAILYGLVQPPELAALNNTRCRVLRRHSNIAVVEVPGLPNELQIPVGNLLFDPPGGDGQVVNGTGSPSLPGGVATQASSPPSEVEQLSADLPPGVKMIRIAKPHGKPLGLRLKNMLLDGVEPDTPAEDAGADMFMGWRLTQVNGVRVAQTEDVRAAAGESEEVLLIFEALEVTVRKYPEEKLGAELMGLTIGQISPGTPADRAGLAAYIGHRITHLNGHPVITVHDITSGMQGCDSVRLRLHVDEANVPLPESGQLGLQLDSNMFLKGTQKGSASRTYGVGAFVGKRLTHVNALPVYSAADVQETLRMPRGDGSVSVRFDISDYRMGRTPSPQSTQTRRTAVPLSSGVPTAIHSPPVSYSPPPPPPPVAYNRGSTGYPIGGPSVNILQIPHDSSVFISAGGQYPAQPGSGVAAAGLLGGPQGYSRVALPAPGAGGLGAVSPMGYREAPLPQVPSPLSAPVLSPARSGSVFRGYSVPSPAPLGGALVGLEGRAANPPLVKPWDVYRAESLVASAAAGRAGRDAEEQRSRIAHLEQKVRELEREKVADSYLPPWLQRGSPEKQLLAQGGHRPAPWESPVKAVGGRGGGVSPPQQGGGGLQMRAMSPQRTAGRACATCGGLPEVECQDCALRYCRTCCAAAHSNSSRLRSTHINIVPLPAPFGGYGRRTRVL